MENQEQEGFKHIPVRCYNEVSSNIPYHTKQLRFHNLSIKFKDGTFLQKLIQPNSPDKNHKRTLQDLLNDLSTPARKAGKYLLKIVLAKGVSCKTAIYFYLPNVYLSRHLE